MTNLKFILALVLTFNNIGFASNRTYTEAVTCFDSVFNDFDGIYSIDYVLKQKSLFGPFKNRDHIAANKQLSMIKNILKEKHPELGANLENFLQNLENTENGNSKYLWINENISVYNNPNPIIFHDIRKIPENCLFFANNPDMTISMEQIIRMEEKPNKKFVYHYYKKSYDFIKKTRPTQFSYMITNEWLWTFFRDELDASPVTRANQLLHDPQLKNLSPQRLQIIFESLGIGL